MKKTLAIILAILMIVTTIPMAFAAEGETKVIYLDDREIMEAGAQLFFYDSMGNNLGYTTETIYDTYYNYLYTACTVSVDAVKYYWEPGYGGGIESPSASAIPENADTFIAHTGEWSCLHQMGASLVEDGTIYECEICGGKCRIFYTDISDVFLSGDMQMHFFNNNGDTLTSIYTDVNDDISRYIVTADAVKYYYEIGGGGSGYWEKSAIPENVDTYAVSSKSWYCSHNMNTSGEQTCGGQICSICGENYGEADPNAHDWSNLDGICANGCGAECDHAGQTGTCTICGMNLHTCDFSGEWKYNSEKHWKECTCGETSEEAEHTLVQVEEKAPTCSAAGYEAYEYCTVCTYTTYAQKEALNHKDTLVQVEAQAPTCTEIGWDAYEYCTACDYATTYTEIPVDTDAHDWSNKDGICARENCGYECVHANYADGACDNCDVKQKYTVRMETKLSKGVEFVGNPVAIHGEDLIIEFKNLVSEKCNDVSLFKLTIGANSFYEFEFDENGITFDGTVLTIPGELVNGDVETHANAYTQARIKLNGGKFSPECPPDIVEEYFIENDYAISNKMLVGYTNSVKDTFVKDKHTIKSILASDGNDYNKIYYFSPNSDLEMTIEWECLPENFENGVCVECGYECPHEWSEGVLTRPTKTEEGYYTYICSACGATKTEAAERPANYAEFKELLEKVKGYVDENLTDSMLQEVNNVINFFELDANHHFIKGEENIVSQLAEQLNEFIEVVEKGIANGSAVKVDGSEIVSKMYIEWGKKIEADGLADAYIEFMDNEKATEEAMAKDGEIQKFAGSLEGSVAENADNIEQLEGMVNEFLASFENCLNGAHNVREYKESKPAKCGENAIEEGTCWFCGEVLTREVPDSALTHSFTKYEVTEEAKCGVEGKEVAACDNGCGETDEKAIAALTHKDADGDYKCDNGCGHEFEKPVTPEEPTPDTPDEPTDEEDTCTDCGKVHTSFFSEIICFFAKIINFIKKLFA